MHYPPTAVERAMKIQEVILRAMSGQQTWLQAADILGMSARSLRRWRHRYEVRGYDGLWDRRRRVPSPRRAPFAEVQRVLQLYRQRYRGFNVRHFYQVAQRAHGLRLSYTFVKLALQRAGLVPKRRARGRHRRRREPRPCVGELLHLDGSRHAWLALCPSERQTLITVVDDATTCLLYAELEPQETTAAVMRALRAVLQTHGIPMAPYTDWAHWAVHTPTASGPPDPTKPTQVGHALRRLGIEHILASSPQARGRSERVNRTPQDRLVNELRVARIRTVAAANRYLQTHFLPAYNATFGRAPADAEPAFVPVGRVDLEQILCYEEERTVGQDNTVRLGGLRLQIAKQRGRRTCAGLRVLVRRHLAGHHTIWWGPRLLGRYTPQGRPLETPGEHAA